MARMRYGWAKIRGAYRLSRRNIARIVAAISAAMLWFHTATASFSPADETLMRRASSAMCIILPIEDSMPPTEVLVAVSDHIFAEFAEVFFGLRPFAASAVAADARPVAFAPKAVGRPRPQKCRARRPRPGELRQEDVAEVFGVSRQTVARWEASQTEDGPGNASNPWGYYRSLRTNQELRGSFEMLSNQAKAYRSARERARMLGRRFRMTFVTFKEEWYKHGNARM